MFDLDFTSTLSGLSESRIRRFEKEGLFQPTREHGMKYYTLQDIIAFKLIAVMIRDGLPLKNIECAIRYLKSLKPDQPLTSLVLYHNRKHVLDLTDHPTFNASMEGQTLLKEVAEHYYQAGVGTELEGTRKRVKSSITKFKRRKIEAKKHAVPLDLSELRKELLG